MLGGLGPKKLFVLAAVVLAIIFVVNNVSFIGDLVKRRATAA